MHFRFIDSLAQSSFCNQATTNAYRYNPLSVTPKPTPHAALPPFEPFDSDQFIYELKIDGFRALAYIHNGQGELVSRNRNTFRGFAELATWIAKHLRIPCQGRSRGFESRVPLFSLNKLAKPSGFVPHLYRLTRSRRPTPASRPLPAGSRWGSAYRRSVPTTRHRRSVCPAWYCAPSPSSGLPQRVTNALNECADYGAAHSHPCFGCCERQPQEAN